MRRLPSKTSPPCQTRTQKLHWQAHLANSKCYEDSMKYANDKGGWRTLRYRVRLAPPARRQNGQKERQVTPLQLIEIMNRHYRALLDGEEQRGRDWKRMRTAWAWLSLETHLPFSFWVFISWCGIIHLATFPTLVDVRKLYISKSGAVMLLVNR